MPHEIIAIIVLGGLVVGNFVSQALRRRDWEKAGENSYYQAVAIIVVLIVQRMYVLMQ